MPSGPQYAINILICESVLIEQSDVTTAVRLMSGINVPHPNSQVHFFTVTTVVGSETDFGAHTLRVRALAFRNDQWISIADAPSDPFVFGRRVNPHGVGGFSLITEFNLDVSWLTDFETLWIQAILDDSAATTQAALTLRRV